MKKILLFSLLFLLIGVIWLAESRKFLCANNGKCVTVWKTYNNTCYVIMGRYWGVFKPSLDQSYITTTNKSLGVVLIWKSSSDTVLAQLDSGSRIFNNFSNKVIIADYNLNQGLNDSLYTYFDTVLHVKRYKKSIPLISIPINDMGAL